MANPASSPDPFARRVSSAPREPDVAVTSAEVASTPLPLAPSQASALSAPMRVPRAALTSGRRWRQTARWIGLALFAVGSALLGFVFLQALHGFQEFQRPDFLAQQFSRASGTSTQSMVQGAVSVLAAQVLSVLYLLVLGFIASAIASKGIQFFAASEAVIDEAVASVE